MVSDLQTPDNRRLFKEHAGCAPLVDSYLTTF